MYRYCIYLSHFKNTVEPDASERSKCARFAHFGGLFAPYLSTRRGRKTNQNVPIFAQFCGFFPHKNVRAFSIRTSLFTYKCPYLGNSRLAWCSIDKDEGGSITVDEFHLESALLLAQFREFFFKLFNSKEDAI